MITIIISSYQPHFYIALEKNIAETCGVTYEIIKIENPGLMGICEAYNKGAQKAKSDYLLFLHEDVLFHSKNWGEKLITHLKNPDTGIIGVAGSNYVPIAPCGWYVEGYSYVHLLQNVKSKEEKIFVNSVTQNRNRVFAMDGVFLAMQKAKAQEFTFDEKISGYHAYDLDISLRLSKKYKNYVVSDIFIEHFSKGNPNKAFLDGNIVVRKKCGSKFKTVQDSKIEMRCFADFLYFYFKYSGINIRNALITVRFIPISRIGFSDCIVLLKTYYRYFKYKSYHQEKFSKD